MGKVLMVLKVFPLEGVDPEALAERVRKIVGCNSCRVEDFVFGAKIVRASFVCEDKEARDFEEEAKQVDGVSEVQVEEVGLVS